MDSVFDLAQTTEARAPGTPEEAPQLHAKPQ